MWWPAQFRMHTVDFHFWLGSKCFNDVETNSDVPQNIPFFTGSEVRNLQDLFERQQIATHGKYGKLCQNRLESELGARKVLLVTSGTSALELCSLAICTQPGDEIIMPTYTFVSTATAFVNHGGVPVFVDIRRDTQNIDESKIEDAITEKTKAIVVVHYAGVPCEMDIILDIARRHGLRVIEDNAHGIFSTYKGKNLGTLGDLAALSFHYTKNLSCGEGGAVVVNAPELISRCMVAWEKGTNRFDFIAGKVDKYAWVDKGSSFVMSELNAAVLAAQVCDAFVYFPATVYITQFLFVYIT
jgi:dTDP-4-amino-4,6-dideoxygalactose transaminase